MTDPDQSPHLQEEPQDERGAPGSRDEGGPPGAGPVDRPTATSDEKSHSGVNPQGPKDPDMPQMPAGDQGG
jgi:hypothetical protein